MRAGETSHRTQHAHGTCLQLRHWENQRRLSGVDDGDMMTMITVFVELRR